uniref:Uncharacterized protein n=1 Tax=Siphoviridae sp. ctYh54 TaxID=2826379 RepID=A0A8S5MDT3_9CAUD|nr:MAG TPA: hypothetical protein [Siphoviridae sp. ctYh54]
MELTWAFHPFAGLVKFLSFTDFLPNALSDLRTSHWNLTDFGTTDYCHEGLTIYGLESFLPDSSTFNDSL